MKVIKFRFWSGRKMFYDLDNVMECLKQQMAYDQKELGLIQYDHVGLNKSSFMQFTGLQDKSGKDCYEKDYDDEGTMIDWCEECCGYQFFQIDIPSKDVCFCHNCEGNFILQDHINSFKISGNIFSGG